MSRSNTPAGAMKMAADAALIIVIVFVLGSILVGANFPVPAQPGQADVTPGTGSYVNVGGDLDQSQDFSVKPTLSNALIFTGSTHVDASIPKNVTNGSWTVCSTVELGDGANLNATYTIAALKNETITLEYDAGDWAVYYDNGSADARASITATHPQGTSGGLFSSGDPWTSVCGRYNESVNQLRVFEDDTASPPASLTAATASRNVSWEWVGRQDEIRVFNLSVSNATIATYASDPIKPLPGTNRVARLMLDEGSGSSTHVYFAGTTASVTAPEWGAGVDAPNLESGTDYTLQESPLRLKILAGGYADGAPVVWVVGDNIWYDIYTSIGELILTGLGLMVLTVVAVTVIFALQSADAGGGGR